MPLVLGLVLGSIMVERLTAGASQITSAADLVNRPVAGLLASVILVIVLATTATGIFRRPGVSRSEPGGLKQGETNEITDDGAGHNVELRLTSWAKADYPDGPVQFIVPWPPGDFEDILTGMIAKNMQEKTGVPPVSSTAPVAVTALSPARSRS